jgi:hypothetical protein
VVRRTRLSGSSWNTKTSQRCAHTSVRRPGNFATSRRCHYALLAKRRPAACLNVLFGHAPWLPLVAGVVAVVIAPPWRRLSSTTVLCQPGLTTWQVHTTEDYFRDKNRKAGGAGAIEYSHDRDESEDDVEGEAGPSRSIASNAAHAGVTRSCGACQAQHVHVQHLCAAGAGGVAQVCSPSAGAVGRCAGSYFAPGVNAPAYMCVPPYMGASPVHFSPWQTQQQQQQMYPVGLSQQQAMAQPPGMHAAPPGMHHPQPGMHHLPPGMHQPQPGMPPQRAGAPAVSHMQAVAAHPGHQPHPVAHLQPGQHPMPLIQPATMPQHQQRMQSLQPLAPAQPPATAASGHPMPQNTAYRARNHKNLVIEAPARSETLDGAQTQAHICQTQCGLAHPSVTGTSPSESPAGWFAAGFVQPGQDVSGTDTAGKSSSDEVLTNGGISSVPRQAASHHEPATTGQSGSP